MTREEVAAAGKLVDQGKMILAKLTVANERLLWLEEGREQKVAFFVRGATGTVTVDVDAETMSMIQRVVKDSLTKQIAALERELAELSSPLTTHHSPPTKEDPCSTNRS